MAHLRERDNIIEVVDSLDQVRALLSSPAGGNPRDLNGGSIPVTLPVASRAQPSSRPETPLSDGTTQGGTSRIMHVALVSCHGLRLVYGNYYNLSGVETVGPNDITVGAAIEIDNSNAVVLPVTFNGATQVTIKPGGHAISDPIGAHLSKGTVFYSRTFVSVSAGQKFPRGSVQTITANVEWHNYPAGASVGTDLTALGSGNIAAVGGVSVYAPYAILGSPTLAARKNSVPIPSIGIVGDSIASGYWETGSTYTDWGYILRALNNNYPFMRVSYQNATPAQWKATGGTGNYRRSALLSMAGITAIICELGINEISSSNLQADLLAVWNDLAKFGVPIYQCTLTPQTTSTDSWATTGNQTVTANESKRTSANDYIRTVPAPLTGIFEVADLAETSRNSGIWIPTYTSDGVHPNSTGAPVLAAAISPSTFGTAAV